MPDARDATAATGATGKKPGKTFELWATVVAWHDGDTAYGWLDQGYWTYRGAAGKPIRMRCALIAAPELDEDGGIDAREYAKQLAPPGEYPCRAYKPDPDSFGRPLVDLMLPDGRLFSAAMLESGHASVYR